jgi:Domain of unknown function (DUF4340)
MSEGPNKKRAKTAGVLAAMAVATGALAVGSIWVQRSVSGEQTLSGKVLPDFSADMPQVVTITIAAAGGSYNLVRKGAIWVIPERGDYAVAPPSLASLAKGLADLSYKTARTSDPAQFARLGVADPGPKSDSVLISLKGASSQLLNSLYIGKKADAIFVRKAGSNEVFEADGKLPELSSLSYWLDLKVIDITAESIASVGGQHAKEAPFDIVRRPDGGFAPVGGQANVTATTCAIALTKWAPLDVMAASALTTDPIASHVTNLRDGTSIRAQAYEERGRKWVVLSAQSADDAQNDGVAKINLRTDGWAFELSASDFADLTFTKSALLNGPDVTQQQ